MAIEGQLEDVGLADICQLLAMGRKTGCLTVTDHSNFGYVYFDQGRVIYATVLNRPDRLGDVLVKRGVIAPEVLAAALTQQAKHPERRLGQILIERGELTPEELRKYVSVQIEEAAYHLFGWERGYFRFEPDQRPEEDEALLVSLNPEGLLLEAARRVDEWSLIQKKVPSMDLVFRVEKAAAVRESDVDLTPAQEAILELLDGTRTVNQVVLDSGLVEFDVAKAVYGLAQAGYASAEGRGEEKPGPAEAGLARHLELGGALYRAGMLEEAEEEYRAALEIEPDEPNALLRLGLIALRTARPAVALQHIDQVLAAVDDDVDLLRNRALALELLERPEEAIESLDRAGRIDPEDEQVILARAILLLKGGDPGGALDDFRRYRQVGKGRKEPEPMYFAYGILAAAASGESDEGIAIGREGLERFPASGPILVNLGVLLETCGEGEAAEALYLRAVQQSTPLPQAHKNLGDLAYGRGDRAGAGAHYERAVKLDPALGDDTYSKLGELAYKDGDMDNAREHWQRALELNPANQVVRTNLSMAPKAAGT